MKNKSAIQFLVETLAETGILHSSDIEQAKEMEEQQIFDAWKNGFREFYDGSSTPEEYYNETFKDKL